MTCTDASWAALWEAFNINRTDTIRVPRKALEDVVACHGETPTGLIVIAPRPSSASVEVNRASLFLFLNHHGAIRCDHAQAGAA